MNRIKELREARGWSQRELAERLGCVSMTVCRYEADADKLYPSLMEKLAGIFEVTPSDLLGWNTAPPLDVALLAQALLVTEDWLSRQSTLPDANTKARITAALYEMALRDRHEGGEGRIAVAPLEPVLRLLLPA